MSLWARLTRDTRQDGSQRHPPAPSAIDWAPLGAPHAPESRVQTATAGLPPVPRGPGGQDMAMGHLMVAIRTGYIFYVHDHA